MGDILEQGNSVADKLLKSIGEEKTPQEVVAIENRKEVIDILEKVSMKIDSDMKEELSSLIEKLKGI